MIIVHADRCPQNHHCPSVLVCPVGAIIQTTPDEAPHIDHDKCIECGKCADACPVFEQKE